MPNDTKSPAEITAIEIEHIDGCIVDIAPSVLAVAKASNGDRAVLRLATEVGALLAALNAKVNELREAAESATYERDPQDVTDYHADRDRGVREDA